MVDLADTLEPVDAPDTVDLVDLVGMLAPVDAPATVGTAGRLDAPGNRHGQPRTDSSHVDPGSRMGLRKGRHARRSHQRPATAAAALPPRTRRAGRNQAGSTVPAAVGRRKTALRYRFTGYGGLGASVPGCFFSSSRISAMARSSC